HRRDRASDRLACARDRVEYPRDRDQLPRKNRKRSRPQQHRDHSTHSSIVAKLEIVAGRVEIVLLRQAPDLRAYREREYHRTDARRTDPPPRRESVPVSESRRADRRTRADVGGEQCREDQSRAESSPRDKEVA